MRWRINLAVIWFAASVAAEVPPPGDPNHWLEILRLGETPISNLGSEQALVAAELARRAGDGAARERALERAASGGPLAEVARLELARLLLERKDARALDLVMPTLRQWGTHELLAAAVTVAEGALARSDVPVPADLPDVVSRLPRDPRRRLTVAIADAATETGRRDLKAVLRRSQRDLAALRAARVLLRAPVDAEEIFLAAKSLYLHGLYGEAAPLLERLSAAESGPRPSWEAPFLRGRCDFRLGRFDDAERWYRVALSRVSTREERADLWVHLARCLELSGDLDGAAEASRRAVVTKASDDRRLLLARLRLLTGREDLAVRGIHSTKSRSSKARGWQLVALSRLEDDLDEEALAALDRVDRNPWFGPSQAIAAEVEWRLGRPDRALRRLEGAAHAMDVYWLQRASDLVGRLPAGTVTEWRETRRAELARVGRSRSSLARWARIEPDPGIVRMLQARPEVTDAYALKGADALKPRGLAGRLWELGLRDLAVRWDPRSFPRGSAAESLWTARRFLDAGRSDLAIRAADGAWRQAGSDLPIRLQPRELQEALYPVPWRTELSRVGARAGVPWELVAAVAREESRWDPEVLSVVGARGLMQLMPATAEAAAARAGRPSPSAEALFDPETSLELGAWELAELLRGFEGNAAAAVAAYNAGSAQSALWLGSLGGRQNESLFVAGLTFRATRHYTAAVLAGRRIIEDRLSVSLDWPGSAVVTPTSVPSRIGSPHGENVPDPSIARSPR
jgi:soluble lytic murein transglycosylase-like protein